MKKVRKVFRNDGSLSPAFAARVQNEVEVYHVLAKSLAVTHLYGASDGHSATQVTRALMCVHAGTAGITVMYNDCALLCRCLRG